MSDINRNAVRLMHADKLFIDGRWVAPASDGRIDVISPYNETIAVYHRRVR